MSKPVFSNCNVCGRGLVRDDELAMGMCAICSNEEIDPTGEKVKVTINSSPESIERWREYRQALFDHMAREHGLTLLESDMNDIEQIVLNNPCVELLRQTLKEERSFIATLQRRQSNERH